MADTETASATMAENEKTTTAAEHEPALQTGNEVGGDVAAEPAKDTARESKAVEITTEIQDKPADKPAGSTAEPSSEKKRKHSPADDRDWRDRRDADNRRDNRDRSRDRGGRGRRDDRNGHRGGRGGRGGPRKDYNANVRTNFIDQAESSDPDEIRKQVEFYFSDSNLPTDKFLLTQVGGSENKPVPVKVIHSFKRMRHFQPYSAVVAALKESTTLNIIGVEGSEEIQRKTALPENITANPQVNVHMVEDVTRTRSIYVKGFGEETSTSQFDIENFFAPFGPINSVRLRRNFPEKEFKGSVFVEFDSEETQQQFLELENKPKWKGEDLKWMSKEEYCKEKVDGIKAGTVRSNDADDDGFRGGRGRGRGRGRGGRGRGQGRGGYGRGRDHDLDRDGDDRDHGRRGKHAPRSRSRSPSYSRSRSRSPYRYIHPLTVAIVGTMLTNFCIAHQRTVPRNNSRTRPKTPRMSQSPNPTLQPPQALQIPRPNPRNAVATKPMSVELMETQNSKKRGLRTWRKLVHKCTAEAKGLGLQYNFYGKCSMGRIRVMVRGFSFVHTSFTNAQCWALGGLKKAF